MTNQSDKKIIRVIPNCLTIGRIVLTVIVLAMILYSSRTGREKDAFLLAITFVLFLIAGLTDIVDGKIARKYDVTSKFGRTVDPLADKTLVCGAFICFAIVGQPKLANLNLGPISLALIHWGTALILLSREIIVQARRHIAESRGVNFGAVWAGKIKMFVQSFGIGTVLIGWAFVSRPWGDYFTIIIYIIVIAITVISGIQAVRRPIK